jgi:hypothetical protein
MLASLKRIDTSLIEEQGHLSRTPARRDIYHRRDNISYGAHDINEQWRLIEHIDVVIGHFGSASSDDINEQWRLIEHIDVVVGTDDFKKSMSDPTARSNSFKDDCRMFDSPNVNWPYQPTGQLCYCQCIQSMLLTYRKINALLPWLANDEYQRQ